FVSVASPGMISNTNAHDTLSTCRNKCDGRSSEEVCSEMRLPAPINALECVGVLCGCGVGCCVCVVECVWCVVCGWVVLCGVVCGVWCVVWSSVWCGVVCGVE